MTYRSPFSDVSIPDVTLPDVVFADVRAEEAGADVRDRVALRDGFSGLTLTYGELWQAAQTVAGALADWGLEQGDVVALFAPNCPEYAVALYGALLAGAVVTPVNAHYTGDDLAFQLRDTGARVVITSGTREEAARAVFYETDVEQIYVIRDRTPNLDDMPVANFEALMAMPGVAPPMLDLDPAEAVALLPYSSGTTGQPKGVMLTHRNLVANLAQTTMMDPLGPDDTLVGILPFYHIYGLMSHLTLALRQGATVVTMSTFDFESFLDIAERSQITAGFLVPPLVLGLAKHPLVDSYDFSALRYVSCGAAHLSADLARACEARLGCVVKQGYGLAEASPVTHALPPDAEIRPESSGRAIPNTTFRVVDPATGADVPAGERGELWIRGPQVMKGYWNDPAATDRALDADGWLRTGDVVRLDADEYLYVVDRLAEMIEVEGRAVAPTEIEALLLTHPDVMDVAVAPVPSNDPEQPGTVPKAFVVRAPGTNVTAEALMAYVAERAAPWKHLRALSFVSVVPRSPSGKVLRRHLTAAERPASPEEEEEE
jgi:acyl-CoA synthetase (AMP-forming)/AMP-acid ligase II